MTKPGVFKVKASEVRKPMQGEWTQFNPANDDRQSESDPMDRSFALWALGLLIGAAIGWLIPVLLTRPASSWICLGALFGLVITSWIDSIWRRQQIRASS